ncbi:unnamed protein product [Pleuronectes platessa]|uniref:Uncharacterized protein n=1 Tax=Pleuronectes platessa TaxID=8262 RepID=A0A9N7ULN0_PLEPL|nr:unnamed protein product [Pleuronectes platessa]
MAANLTPVPRTKVHSPIDPEEQRGAPQAKEPLAEPDSVGVGFLCQLRWAVEEWGREEKEFFELSCRPCYAPGPCVDVGKGPSLDRKLEPKRTRLIRCRGPNPSLSPPPGHWTSFPRDVISTRTSDSLNRPQTRNFGGSVRCAERNGSNLPAVWLIFASV